MTTWTEYAEDDGCYCNWCGEPLERGTVVVWRDQERGHEDCELMILADDDDAASALGVATA